MLPLILVLLPAAARPLPSSSPASWDWVLQGDDDHVVLHLQPQDNQTLVQEEEVGVCQKVAEAALAWRVSNEEAAYMGAISIGSLLLIVGLALRWLKPWQRYSAPRQPQFMDDPERDQLVSVASVLEDVELWEHYFSRRLERLQRLKKKFRKKKPRQSQEVLVNVS